MGIDLMATKLTTASRTYSSNEKDGVGTIQQVSNSLLSRTFENFKISMLDKSKMEGMPNSPILLWIYCITQQLNFYDIAILRVPDSTPALKVIVLNRILQNMAQLLLLIIRNIQTDLFEMDILKTLYERHTIIVELLLKNYYPKFTKELCKNSCKSVRLFKKRILYYMCDIIWPHTLLDEAIRKVDIVQNDLNSILATLPNDN